MIQLERRMWNGVYKITWQNIPTLQSWVKMCHETVMQLTKEVVEYKSVNSAINELLEQVSSKMLHLTKYC